MDELESVEIKAFVPAKDYELSKSFYKDLGFTMGSDEEGVAYFFHGNCSFLLQNYYEHQYAQNLMMHMLVKDINKWHEYFVSNGISEKYKIKISEITKQPWGMFDFTVFDPSGVLWRFGQNINA
jgi:predicted lactoylglutathione lyase